MAIDSVALPNPQLIQATVLMFPMTFDISQRLLESVKYHLNNGMGRQIYLPWLNLTLQLLPGKIKKILIVQLKYVQEFSKKSPKSPKEQ